MKQNGVIKVLRPRDRSWYTSQDVQNLLGVGRSKAYEVIKTLRNELIESGTMSPVYPEGKIPKSYFDKRMCMGRAEEKRA